MRAETKRNWIDIVKDLPIDIIGGALYAAGIYSFASAAQFAPGGIAGLSVIINHFTSLPIGVLTLLLGLVMNTQRTNTSHKEVVDRHTDADVRRRETDV